MKRNTNLSESIILKCIEFTNRYFRFDDWNNENHQSFQLEIVGRNEDKGMFDGMQIIFEDGIFEVSEYQAGKNQNELWIYKETKSLKVALKCFMKGNNQKPIKVWN